MKKLLFYFILFYIVSIGFSQEDKYTERSLDSIVHNIIDLPCSVEEVFNAINEVINKYRVYYVCYDYYGTEFKKGYVKDVMEEIVVVISQEDNELFMGFLLKDVEDSNNKNNKKFKPKRNPNISYTPINIHRFKYRKIRKYTVVDITIYRKPKTQN